MAKITLAQQLATTLEQAGVKRIWGLTVWSNPL
jgi:pyruvate dehydrogenase (quinone)